MSSITIQNQVNLKQLSSRLNEARSELEAERLRQREINAKVGSLESRIHKLQEQIKIYTQGEKGLTITEHAIIRYLERVIGLNIEELKNKIVPSDVLEKIKSLGGSGSFPVEGCTLKVKGYTVVSIVTKD